jgi:L-ascorbate metabolism protein UlaG (beta-lactamase superfamily)
MSGPLRIDSPAAVYRVIWLTIGLLFFNGINHHVHAQQASEATQQEVGLVLKWLGTAGWEIQVGQTVILIDPFITRGEASPGVEWKTDEAAVLRVIKRADYIFAGHSHADHIADLPFIAKKFGSKVIGSRTTTNIALTGGVDKSPIVTISGGEKLVFK